MKVYSAALFAALALPAGQLLAQEAGSQPADAQASVPVQASPSPALTVARAEPRAALVLPANTEVLLKMNQEVTTKGKTWSEGDTFDMSVVHDVMLGDYVVIPRGSRGVGRITWMTNKGAFGKSGKMDIELEYIEVSGRRIPINGTYRQEGEGNTVATVGGVILAGVFAGFITGKSGRIPQGRELMAHTQEDIPLAVKGPVPVPAPQAVPVYAASPDNSMAAPEEDAPTAEEAAAEETGE